MSAIPFAALSVHHIISTVGADVGFASLIGLALLVLLFFSQARETATLRHRADEAGLRIQELEGELADLAEQLAAIPAEISVRASGPRVAAQPEVPVTAGAGPGSALPPSAPAGVGAPALAAATRLIPDPVGPLPEYQPATAAGNGNGSPRPVVAASAATVQRPVQAPAAGSGRPPLGTPPPRVGGGGRPAPRPGLGSGSGQGRPPGAGPSRPAGPARPPGAPLRPPPRRSRTSLVIGGLIAAVAVAAVVVAVILLTGGKGASSASRSVSSATLAGSHRRISATSAVQPSSVTVSVLNGTDMQGLALTVFNRLLADGYKKGSTPANAADQTHTSTIVAYMATADRRDALAVAKSLKLTAASVQPVDPTTKATVCPPAQACTSRVVVTVGTDLAQQ